MKQTQAIKFDCGAPKTHKYRAHTQSLTGRDHHNYSHILNPEDSIKKGSKLTNIWNGLNRLETDDIKTQFKYRRLREIEEMRKFEADEKRIKDQLRKRKIVDKSLMAKKPKRKNKSVKQNITDTTSQELSSQVSHQIINNVSQLQLKLNNQEKEPRTEEIPEQIVISPQEHTQQSKKKPILRPMLQKIFSSVLRPKFEINNRDSDREKQAINRLHRRESYCKHLQSIQQRSCHRDQKPLDYKKLLEWKIEQDQRAHPAKYRRLTKGVNMSAKQICFSKDVDVIEKETIVNIGNEYMWQARKLLKKIQPTQTRELEKVEEPTFKHRYIDYMPLVKQPRVPKNNSPSPDDLQRRAKQLEAYTLRRIEEYVDRRSHGLRYTDRATYQKSIDSCLIESVRAKLACLENI